MYELPSLGPSPLFFMMSLLGELEAFFPFYFNEFINLTVVIYIYNVFWKCYVNTYKVETKPCACVLEHDKFSPEVT